MCFKHLWHIVIYFVYIFDENGCMKFQVFHSKLYINISKKAYTTLNEEKELGMSYRDAIL
jgi:hypothetical protein